MFLTFNDYSNMGGDMDLDEFNRFEYKARAFINQTTHNRIRDETPVRECVQKAMFELIDLLKSKSAAEDSGSTGVSSKTNDGVSVTYASGESVDQYWKRKTNSVLVEYLADEVDSRGIPLLYGGVEYDSFRR